MNTGFDEYYELEFRQPYKFNVSAELEAALRAIETRLCLKMEQRDKNFMSPFGNSGNKFECDAFAVEAYSWSDEEQPWNFKWRDLEVSWYKYLGRGMSANRKITTAQVEEMLDDCYKAIERMK